MKTYYSKTLNKRVTVPEREEPVVICFRCDPAWRRKVAKALIDRNESLQAAGVQALSKYLRIGQ
jgi:hypothetical protein